MEKILTVIIPTYNMERYLDKCLSSLILSDCSLMQSLEVLVVIDGATDKSAEIARSYQSLHPDTFCVIEKENGNYGSCVNRGLAEAKGKYVKILDADDSFNTQSLAYFLTELHRIDVDLVLTDYNLVDESQTVLEHREFSMSPNGIYQIENVLEPVSELEMHAIAYRRSMLLSMAYRQTEGISYTDTEWAFKPLVEVNNVCYLNLQVYNYLVGRQGQTMDAKVLKKSMPQMIRVHTGLMAFYKEKSLDCHKARFIFDHRIDNFVSRTYGWTLQNKLLSNDQLKSLDQSVRTLKPDLYERMGRSTINFIKYVELWRKHDYHLPFVFNLLVKVIFLKRKLMLKL